MSLKRPKFAVSPSSAPATCRSVLIHAWPQLAVDPRTRGKAAQRYASFLGAPSKQLVWFEKSAHTPQLEESERFRDLLMEVRAGQPATT